MAKLSAEELEAQEANLPYNIYFRNYIENHKSLLDADDEGNE